MADSMVQAGKTQEEIEEALKGRRTALAIQARNPGFSNLFGPLASLGCWDNPWPLRITYQEGWAPPEALAFQERALAVGERAIEMAKRLGEWDGAVYCSGPIGEEPQ